MRGFGIIFTTIGVVCLFANSPDAGVFCTLIGVMIIAGSRGEVN
jgi:hypothetical protein